LQGLTPVIPTTQEVEIRRIVVQGQLGQKVSEIPITNNKVCVVVYTCNFTYPRDIGRRFVVQNQSPAKM
jgi:hypothetical protein